MKTLNNCYVCGYDLKDQQDKDGEGLYCPECNDYRYKNPKPVAGTYVVKDGKILLIKRGHEPNKDKWSFPAGFVDNGEGLKEAALRELKEETNIRAEFDEAFLADTIQIEYHTNYAVGVILGVKRGNTSGTIKAGDDAARARYWTVKEMKNNRDKIEVEQVIEVAEKVIDSVDED